MSDEISSKPGPSLPEAVQEVQGVFPSDAALQDAVAKLTLAGFDRADLSLPATAPTAGEATPDMGAAPPTTDTDLRQARTMGTSMAGTIGAFAAAGATIATGGAAGVAIAAAAAVGAGSALAAKAAGDAAIRVEGNAREDAAKAGQLVLAVHAATAERRGVAEEIMRAAGASNVAAIERASGTLSRIDTGVNSTGWTG